MPPRWLLRRMLKQPGTLKRQGTLKRLATRQAWKQPETQRAQKRRGRLRQ